MAVVVVVCALWAITGPVLNLTHAESDLIWPAWYYALILMASLPARVITGVVNQFFQAQLILYPSVAASMTAVVLNVIFGLVFVLGIPFNPNPDFNVNNTPPNSTMTGGYGFDACPIVTSSMEWVQVFVLLAVFVGCCKLGRECWPDNGFACANVLSRAKPEKEGEKGQLRMWMFIKMWFPAALVRCLLHCPLLFTNC